MALTDLTPVTRMESILNGDDIEPVTREEYFIRKAASGGGGGPERVVYSNTFGYKASHTIPNTSPFIEAIRNDYNAGYTTEEIAARISGASIYSGSMLLVEADSEDPTKLTARFEAYQLVNVSGTLTQVIIHRVLTILLTGTASFTAPSFSNANTGAYIALSNVDNIISSERIRLLYDPFTEV